MRRPILLAAFAALVGCGDADRAAGGSSYETENAVAIQIMRPDGSPAANALVRARPFSWIDSALQDTTGDLHADSQGRISLRLPSGSWRLEALDRGMVAMLDVSSRSSFQDMGRLVLALPGRLAGYATPGARIGAAGLKHHAVAGVDGRFLFDSLPCGLHVLRAFGSSARAFALAKAGETKEVGGLHADTVGQILVDDFEDGDSRVWYGPWTGGGWWWVDADSSVHLSPDSVSQSPERSVFADGEGGKVLQFSAAFPAGASSTTWAQCGVDFGRRPLDLSGLVSVRFRARGIGTVALIVNIDSASWDEVPRAEIVLDTFWQEFEVSASHLQLPTSSGKTLDSAALVAKLRNAVGLTWSLSSSGDLWLDEIRLVGPSPALLWGASPPP